MAGESPAITSGAIPLPQAQTQQQQQTAVQGIDILNDLIKQRNQLNEGIEQLTKQATVPVSGSSAGTSPILAMKQIQPFQPAPLIDRETVGAKSTRDKGIANTIIAASNVVGQYKEKEEREKQRVLAVDLERVFQAQDGIRQAQQVLQIDPSNKDAQNTIQKNQQIIDAMLSDPKRRKQFEKALDISFTDPSKNDAIEHGALKQAAQSYSQQLEKQIPQEMQPNVVAQQKLQLIQDQQQAIDKMISQIIPALLREQGAQSRAEMTDQTKRDIAQAQIESKESLGKLTAATHYQSVIDSAKIHSNTLISTTAMRNKQSADNVAALIQNRIDLLNTKLDDPIYQLKGTQANSKLLTDQINSLTKQNKQLSDRKQQLMAMKVNKLISDDEYAKQIQSHDALIKANDSMIKEYQSMYNQNSAYIENLIKGLQSGNSKSSISSDGSAAKSSNKVGPTEDTEGTKLDPNNF